MNWPTVLGCQYSVKVASFNPPHPGEILRADYLEPLGLSVTAAATALGVTRKTLSALINESAGVSPAMAHRLSRALDATPEFWLNLQAQYDLWQTRSLLSSG